MANEDSQTNPFGLSSFENVEMSHHFGSFPAIKVFDVDAPPSLAFSIPDRICNDGDVTQTLINMAEH